MIAPATGNEFPDLPLFADTPVVQAAPAVDRPPAPEPRPAAGVVTADDLLKRYAVLKRLSAKSLKNYRFTLAHFSGFLGHEATVEDLDDDIVSAFLLWRSQQPCRGRKVSAASVEKDRVQILAVWRYGARKRHCREFPDVGSWRVPKRVRPCYTTADLERLLIAAGELHGNGERLAGKPTAWWWRTLIRVAYETGERRGGLMGLRWRDVDLEGLRIVFRAETRKGGREDIVRAITPALAAELSEQIGGADAPVWPWSGPDTSFYHPFKTLCRRAGVPYHALHGIRRTSASMVARGGGDATAHMGHSSPTTTKNHYLVGEIVGAKNGLEFLPAIGGAAK